MPAHLLELTMCIRVGLAGLVSEDEIIAADTDFSFKPPYSISGGKHYLDVYTGQIQEGTDQFVDQFSV